MLEQARSYSGFACPVELSGVLRTCQLSPKHWGPRQGDFHPLHWMLKVILNRKTFLFIICYKHISFFSSILHFVQLPKLHVNQCIFPWVTFCLWLNIVCFLRQRHVLLAFFKAHNCIYSTKEACNQNMECKLVRLLHGESCCQCKLEDLSSILRTQVNTNGNHRHRKILFFIYV